MRFVACAFRYGSSGLRPLHGTGSHVRLVPFRSVARVFGKYKARAASGLTKLGLSAQLRIILIRYVKFCSRMETVAAFPFFNGFRARLVFHSVSNKKAIFAHFHFPLFAVF